MTAVLAYSWEIAPQDYRRVMEVNYLGFVHGTLAALRHMRPRDRGTIVQVGSALAHRAIPLQATYCASKFAIRAFTDSLRCELRHDGSKVRLTMVQMPGLNTPQFTWVRTTLRRRPKPVAPVYQPEIAARAVVWASEHPRRELFVGANTAAVIWGSRIAPWAADRYLARTNIAAQQDLQTPIDPQATARQPLRTGARRPRGPRPVRRPRPRAIRATRRRDAPRRRRGRCRRRFRHRPRRDGGGATQGLNPGLRPCR